MPSSGYGFTTGVTTSVQSFPVIDKFLYLIMGRDNRFRYLKMKLIQRIYACMHIKYVCILGS